MYPVVGSHTEESSEDLDTEDSIPDESVTDECRTWRLMLADKLDEEGRHTEARWARGPGDVIVARKGRTKCTLKELRRLYRVPGWGCIIPRFREQYYAVPAWFRKCRRFRKASEVRKAQGYFLGTRLEEFIQRTRVYERNQTIWDEELNWLRAELAEGLISDGLLRKWLVYHLREMMWYTGDDRKRKGFLPNFRDGWREAHPVDVRILNTVHSRL